MLKIMGQIIWQNERNWDLWNTMCTVTELIPSKKTAMTSQSSSIEDIVLLSMGLEAFRHENPQTVLSESIGWLIN